MSALRGDRGRAPIEWVWARNANWQARLPLTCVLAREERPNRAVRHAATFQRGFRCRSSVRQPGSLPFRARPIPSFSRPAFRLSTCPAFGSRIAARALPLHLQTRSPLLSAQSRRIQCLPTHPFTFWSPRVLPLERPSTSTSNTPRALVLAAPRVQALRRLILRPTVAVPRYPHWILHLRKGNTRLDHTPAALRATRLLPPTASLRNSPPMADQCSRTSRQFLSSPRSSQCHLSKALYLPPHPKQAGQRNVRGRSIACPQPNRRAKPVHRGRVASLRPKGSALPLC